MLYPIHQLSGQLRLWYAVQETRENAASCRIRGDAELGWAEMVCSLVLDEALRGSPHKCLVQFMNM